MVAKYCVPRSFSLPFVYVRFFLFYLAISHHIRVRFNVNRLLQLERCQMSTLFLFISRRCKYQFHRFVCVLVSRLKLPFLIFLPLSFLFLLFCRLWQSRCYRQSLLKFNLVFNIRRRLQRNLVFYFTTRFLVSNCLQYSIKWRLYGRVEILAY